MEHSQSNFGLDKCHKCGVRRKQVANPTTNYGFVLPSPTDLVTDLPADFDVALQGVDTRLKALQPGTTEGDLAYSSSTANTNTRLAIGTTGQVLTVAGGVPSWASPATGGTSWTLLNAGGTALTGAQTISVSGISAKNDLFILFSGASSASAQTEIRIRFNGDAAANYSTFGLKNANPTTYASTTTFNEENQNGNNHIRLAQTTTNANSTASGFLRVSGANTSGPKLCHGAGGADPAGGNAGVQYVSGGLWSGSAAITSIAIISEFGNFDAGTVYVYTSA
jgi:hypothetical protein